MSSTASVGGSNSAYAYSTSRKVDRLISRADQNGDGQISLNEFDNVGQNLPVASATSSTSGTSATGASAATTSATDRATLFGQIDTNGDGQLSSDELSTYKQQQVTAARGALLNLQEVFGGASGSGGRTDGVGHAHRGHHQHAAPTQATDGSGTASQGDATGQVDAATASTGAPTDPVSAFFSAVDTNSDGSISKSELSSFVTQMLSRLGSSTPTGSSTAAANTTT